MAGRHYGKQWLRTILGLVDDVSLLNALAWLSATRHRAAAPFCLGSQPAVHTWYMSGGSGSGSSSSVPRESWGHRLYINELSLGVRSAMTLCV